jgi:hypothetical protein
MESVWKEQKGPNYVLFEVIKTHPDLQSQHISEIMSWAKLKGQLHPMELAHLLSNMKGVSEKVSNIISQKYTLALQIESQRPNADIQMTSLLQPMHPNQQMGPMPPGVPPMYPQQQQQTQPVMIQTPYGPQPVYPQYPQQQYYGQQMPQYFQPPNPQTEELKKVIARQDDMIADLQAARERDRTEDQKRRDQELLDAKLRKISEDGERQMNSLLDEIRGIREEKDEKRARNASDEMLARLESMHADVRERLRDVETRYAGDTGSPALRVELAKLNKQTEILGKGMANFHETVKTGISTWAESNKPSPLEGKNIAENQFSEADLKKLEKELKKTP